jgi:hypothetical protein
MYVLNNQKIILQWELTKIVSDKEYAPLAWNRLEHDAEFHLLPNCAKCSAFRQTFILGYNIRV